MVHNNLKNIRELKNLTQEYMATSLNISQAAYSRLEKGDIKISESKLEEIAKVLDMNADEINNFDKHKFFNSFNNIKDSNNVGLIISIEDINLVKKLFESKIELLEKMLSITEKELLKYKEKFGNI